MSHYNHGLHDNVDENGNYNVDVYCRCDKCGFENSFREIIKHDSPCVTCKGRYSCPIDIGMPCLKGLKEKE